MIYPTIDELTKGNYNRYQLAIATAKCARLITDEYVRQRAAAENMLTGTKEGGNIVSLIDQDLADKKAVKNAIDSMNAGKYAIVDTPDEAEDAAHVAVSLLKVAKMPQDHAVVSLCKGRGEAVAGCVESRQGMESTPVPVGLDTVAGVEGGGQSPHDAGRTAQ